MPKKVLKMNRFSGKIAELRNPAGVQIVKNPLVPEGRFKTIPGFFVIAHRGASYYAPENTMPSFEKAYEMGADMIELDVVLTKDSVPVVLHDLKVDRTTNGKGPARKFTLSELKQLDAGSWFGTAFQNTTIPTLEAVLKWARNKICLNIEIKREIGTHAVRNSVETLVIELISAYGMREKVIISSFDSGLVRAVKEIDPGVHTALLYNKYRLGTRRAFQLMESVNADGLNLLPRQMRNNLMQLMKEKRVPVWVYTINSEALMRKVIRKGATGIFTDRPDLLREVLVSEFE